MSPASPEAFRRRAFVWTGANWDRADAPARRAGNYDIAVARFTTFLEGFAGFGATEVEPGKATTWHTLPSAFWHTVDVGVASEFVSWVSSGRRPRTSARHAQFQRWFAGLCAEHRNASQRVLAALKAALRLRRRAVRRQRLRLHRRAIRAIASESTIVIRRHGPPAERLPLPAVGRC